MSDRDNPIPGEIWRHYKGHLVVIVSRCVKEDDHTPLVVYRENLTGEEWCRTLENFMMDVEVVRFKSGVGIEPRFSRVLE